MNVTCYMQVKPMCCSVRLINLFPNNSNHKIKKCTSSFEIVWWNIWNIYGIFQQHVRQRAWAFSQALCPTQKDLHLETALSAAYKRDILSLREYFTGYMCDVASVMICLCEAAKSQSFELRCNTVLFDIICGSTAPIWCFHCWEIFCFSSSLWWKYCTFCLTTFIWQPELLVILKIKFYFTI